jgi:hypothetical protein
VPASGMHDKSTYWLDSSGPDKRRIVSVRELTPKQTEQEMLALLQQPREEKHPGTMEVKIDGSAVSQTVTFHTMTAMSGELDLPYSLATGNPLVTPTCCADVAPYIGRRVRVEDGIEGILTGCGIDPDDGEYWFGLDGETPNTEEPNDKCYAFTLDEGHWTFELLPDEPAPTNLMIEPKCPADLDPYIGRRVRILAGSERELVREGILTSTSGWGTTGYQSTGPGDKVLGIDGRFGTWGYGLIRPRSTLVEVLPELPAAEADETSIEDESDDAVSGGYIPSEPVLSFGTVMMQVDGARELVTIEHDGTLTAASGRRLVLTYDGTVITAPKIMPKPAESKLTLAELLAMAPPSSDSSAYSDFQQTVRVAIHQGLVTA